MSQLFFHPYNCGLRNLYIGYAKPKDVMLFVCSACINPKYVSSKRAVLDTFAPIAAHVVFSQAAAKDKSSYGDELADYIEKESLGTVLRSDAVLNPDHGPNYITTYIWTPDQKALEVWWEANKPPEKLPAPTIGQAPYYAGVPMYCPGTAPAKESK